MRKTLFTFLLVFGFAAQGHTQISLQTYDEKSQDKAITIRELNWLNQNFLDKQRRHIDELLRAQYGKQFHQRRSDLPLLQRLIDSDLIAADDKEMTQALGVALGDVFVKENKLLEWVVFEDELGASHAVCMKNSSHCLFPITMLSRRIEVGLEPDVNTVYENALAKIKAHFPKVPYSD